MNLPPRSYLVIKNDINYENIKGKYNKISGKNIDILVGEKLFVKSYFSSNRNVFFLGDFINPDKPKYNNEEVVEEIFNNSNSFIDIMKNSYSLFGKWLVIEENDSEIVCMGDAHTTKSIKYHKNKIGISDIASILAEVFNEKSANDLPVDHPHHQFAINQYIKTRWWCGDATYYPNISSLLPNHKIHLEINNDKNHKVVRNIITVSRVNNNSTEYEEYCLERSIDLLKGFFKALDYRGNYALTVTGGYDSRIMMAASHSVYKKKPLYFITKSSDMRDDHPDISIPKKLCERLNEEFHVYEIYNDSKTFDIIKEYFPDAPVEAYTRHNFTQYINGIENIVYGLIPETISGYYYNRLLRINPKGLVDLARHSGSTFSEKKYGEWLQNLEKETLPEGYSILDLFYWEHRGGRWCSQYVNITDLFQNSLWGFNSREFYDIWMKTPLQIRSWPERRNLIDITRMLGEIYLSIPYQKPSNFVEIARNIVEKNRLTCLFSRQVDYKYRRLKSYLENKFGFK